MTRINLEDPDLLCRSHLTGEWYELPRIVTNVIKCNGDLTGKKPPKRYTVRTDANPSGGEGHMLFFYNKLGWLRKRYLSLISEMLDRGYHPSDNWNPEIFSDKYKHLFNDWEPDDLDISLSRTRLNEMLPDDHDLSVIQIRVLRLAPEYYSLK